MVWHLCGAAVLAAAVALVAWRLGWLQRGGAWASAAVGTAVLGFGGWAAALPLVVFFVSATLLGRLPAGGGARHHGARNARQVAANGAAAGAAAVLVGLGAGPWAQTALAGALAAANADTWATEIGTRFGGRPRALAMGRILAPGASGGMTGAGTAGGLAGAALIAAVARVSGHGAAAVAVLCGGIAGLLADSIAGAALQAVWRCPACGCEREMPQDGCGVPGVLQRGWASLDNDVVNLLATVTGGLIAAALGMALRRGAP